ncbi:hypothetical protein D1872_335350 [compost metagenome]
MPCQQTTHCVKPHFSPESNDDDHLSHSAKRVAHSDEDGTPEQSAKAGDEEVISEPHAANARKITSQVA